ncbi:hypothetical protein HF086_006414 [Spodoptera exigua]|uniref:Gustatory receptor n=1 Tax=Spodoptera exigua TaxID=7107 RepID=A0A922SNY4_SPOEX|nr:hypothetical protein HF086_006414 [Spodoptera exigua]
MLCKIQYVFHVLQISRHHIRDLVIYYWYSVIILNLFALCSLVWIGFLFYSFEAMNSAFVFFLFDVSTVYTFLILKLLRKTLLIWIEKVVQHKNIGDGKKEYWNALFYVYLNIQEIFMMLNELSGYISGQRSLGFMIYVFHFIVSERKTLKNILRLQKTSFQKMTACGFFSVDASLPVQYSSFATTYVLVLLQFKFL